MQSVIQRYERPSAHTSKNLIVAPAKRSSAAGDYGSTAPASRVLCGGTATATEPAAGAGTGADCPRRLRTVRRPPQCIRWWSGARTGRPSPAAHIDLAGVARARCRTPTGSSPVGGGPDRTRYGEDCASGTADADPVTLRVDLEMDRAGADLGARSQSLVIYCSARSGRHPWIWASRSPSRMSLSAAM
jgi:hypothetical protein